MRPDEEAVTDPAKLAEDADACAARVEANRIDGTEFVMLSLTARESRMVAAALRLAEAASEWRRLRRRMMACDLATTERRQREEDAAMEVVVAADAAYRRAKEEA